MKNFLSKLTLPLTNELKPSVSNAIDNINNGLENFVTTATPIVLILSIVSIFLVGIMFIVSDQDGREKAKKRLIYTAVGAGIAILATAIGNYLVNLFSF